LTNYLNVGSSLSLQHTCNFTVIEHLDTCSPHYTEGNKKLPHIVNMSCTSMCSHGWTLQSG